MDGDLVGKVVHYYDKIGVAIVKLDKAIRIGGVIKFVKNNKAFEQPIESIQIEHDQIAEGKKGQEVGIKVNQEAKEGTLVYKV